MIKSWLGIDNLEQRIADLELNIKSLSKPQSYKDIHVKMIDGVKTHKFTAKRDWHGRFAKK